MGCSWNQNTWIQQHCSCNQPSLNTEIQNLVVLENTNLFGIKKLRCHLDHVSLAGLTKLCAAFVNLGELQWQTRLGSTKNIQPYQEQRQRPHLDRLFKSTLPEKHARKRKVCHLFPSFALGCLVFVVSSAGKRTPLKCCCGVGASNNM